MERQKTSDIWLHFTDLPGKIANCKLCKQSLSYKTSITNLKRHLSLKHVTIQRRTDEAVPVELNNENVPRQSNLSSQDNAPDSSRESTPCSSSSILQDQNKSPPRKRSKQQSIEVFIPKKISATQKDHIDKLVMNMFIKDYQPFSMVEDEGFKSLMKVLAPNYTLPSRKYLSNTLLNNMYQNCHDKTLEMLNSAKSVCITTDHWTSLKNENYLGVTAHYIDSEFTMNHKVLQCMKYEGRHDAVTIAKELRRVLIDWQISNKVLIFVTDNAYNIVNAVKLELKKKHYGCFAHKLNLCVQHSLGLKIDEDPECDEDSTLENNLLIQLSF